MTCRTKIDARVANPGDQSWTKNKYVLDFGAYGDTRIIAYANSLDDALDACGDWLIANAPGLLATDAVNDEFTRLKADGATDEAAREAATVDTISIDSGNHYLHAWELALVAENPDRDALCEMFRPR